MLVASNSYIVVFAHKTLERAERAIRDHLEIGDLSAPQSNSRHCRDALKQGLSFNAIYFSIDQRTAVRWYGIHQMSFLRKPVTIGQQPNSCQTHKRLDCDRRRGQRRRSPPMK